MPCGDCMPTDTEAKYSLWEALAALPKPVTKAQIEATAAQILKSTQASEFNAWMESNAPNLLRRLNG